MGMFSYICKGCGHEIIQNEHVRLNGCVGTYDGYGRAGGFCGDDYGSCSAWHVACYNKATIDQKLDDSPSDHAPNQGFGAPKLEFKEGFDAEKPYIIDSIEVITHDDPKGDDISGERHIWIYTKNLAWEDQRDWEKRAEEISEKLWEDHPIKSDGNPDFEAIQDKQYELVGAPPESNAQEFATIEEALEIGIPFAERFDCFDLTIYGRQENVLGAILEKSFARGRLWTMNRIGEPPFELPVLETLESDFGESWPEC